MRLFKRKEVEEVRKSNEAVIQALIGTEDLSAKQALNIPSVNGCLELISNTIASLPVRLYQDVDGQVEEVQDYRLKLLNEETGDLLNSYQAKKAMVRDYLLNGAGYIYINRKGNEIKSMHYVENSQVQATQSVDPIFKSIKILVQGQEYRDFDFIALTRNTVDGFTGRGIIQENQDILKVSFNSLVYENKLVKTGGNKKGFLKAKSRLTQEVMDMLKAGWRNLYSNDNESIVVLNDGLEFQESTNTSVEMQLNENKKANSEEICKLFNMSTKVLQGSATDQEQSTFFKQTILPITVALSTALNKTLLLETEKEDGYYFALDCKALLKGDIEKLFKAYKTAIDANIMQIDEVRFELDLKPLGFNYIKLGLQDVLLNPTTKDVYTPNMNSTANLDHLKGGDKNESGDKE